MRVDLHQIFLDCLRLILRPIAHFCVRHAIKFQEFSDVAKAVFLDVASDELAKEGSSATVSKLSVMTGLQRRDITGRLAPASSSPDSPGNLITRIIGQWWGDPLFSKAGVPRPLTTEGKSSEFASLVRSVNSDLNHHTILFELERIGVIARSDSTAVLQTDAFLASNNPLESFKLLAGDTRDLILSVEENVLLGTKPPHLHAHTSYDNIPYENLPEIRRWFLAQGRKVHKEARKFLSRFDKDINKRQRNKQGSARVVLGTFSFVSKEEGRRAKSR